MSSTTTSWIEIMVFSALFVSVFAIVIAGFNAKYGQSYEVAGLNTTQIERELSDYQGISKTQIDNGAVTQTSSDSGFSLSSGIGIVKGGVNLAWKFVSGGWIETSIGYLGLGEAGTKLSFYLRVIYFIGLIGALLYTLFKVVT